MDGYKTSREYEISYLEQEKKKNKKKNIIITVLLVGILLFITAYLMFFVRRDLPYDEIALTLAEEQDVISAYATWTIDGGCIEGAVSKTPYYLDYENNVEYRDFTFTLSASKWELWRYPGTTKLIDPRIYTNGERVDSEGYVRHIDEEGIAHNMETRYSRIIYENSDGSTVLIWKNEDIPE